MDPIGSISRIGTAGILAASDRFARSAERTAGGNADYVAETVEQVQAKTALAASVAVVKTADEMTKRLLDIRA